MMSRPFLSLSGWDSSRKYCGAVAAVMVCAPAGPAEARQERQEWGQGEAQQRPAPHRLNRTKSPRFWSIQSYQIT